MSRLFRFLALAVLFAVQLGASAQIAQTVVDIPTRAGVTQRLLVLAPPQPRAAVLLFAGGHGGLQIFPNGSMKWGEGNFLVRTRELFAQQGLFVVVVDTPSDRSNLQGFRQQPEHAADIKAIIAWTRATAKVPVWLVGTSRGTQSVGYAATELAGAQGPDGIVLTSTILVDARSRPVPAMPLEKIRVPVLVVHHENDGCPQCGFSNIPALMGKLGNAPRSQLLAFKGGVSKGDPCEAFAHHGFNGIEQDVVQQTAAWILAK
jgi:pimeloyl-ACP methyl ester carboxylesterase